MAVRTFVLLVAIVSVGCALNWCTLTNKTCDANSDCSDSVATGFCCESTGECAESCVVAPSVPGTALLEEACDPTAACSYGLKCISGLCKRDVDVRADGCSCTDDADCLGVCVSGVCVRANRRPGEDCDSNELCASGSCVANACAAGTKARAETCTNTGECGAGLFCMSGHCYDASGPGLGDPCLTLCTDGHVCVSGVCVAISMQVEGEGCYGDGEYCSEGFYCGIFSGVCHPVATKATGEVCDDYCDCQYGHTCALNDTSGSTECLPVSRTACAPFEECGVGRYCACIDNSFECRDGRVQCGVPTEIQFLDLSSYVEEEVEGKQIDATMVLACGDEYMRVANTCNDGSMTHYAAFLSCPDPAHASPEQLTAFARLNCCMQCRSINGLTYEETALMEFQVGRVPVTDCNGFTMTVPGEVECSADTVVTFGDRVQQCDIYNDAVDPTLWEKFILSIDFTVSGLSDAYFQANRAEVNAVMVQDVCNLPSDAEAAPAGANISAVGRANAPPGQHTFSIDVLFSAVSIDAAEAALEFVNEELKDLARKNALLAMRLPPAAAVNVSAGITIEEDSVYTTLDYLWDDSDTEDDGGGGGSSAITPLISLCFVLVLLTTV